MKLKLDETGHVVVSDGKPVYVHDDGKEVAFDAAATVATIARITDESKGFKARAQAAETTLKQFEGITDPKAAKDALAKVANWGDKELIEAGKVEEIKAAAIKAVEEKYAPIAQERDALKGELYSEKIGGAFARSAFIKEKLVLPPDLAQKAFGDKFKIEGGKVLAYDANGNQIYSRAKPGEPADFEEAIETLVTNYPARDSIMRTSGGNGGGARPNGGAGAGQKVMARSEFDRLPAADQMAKMRDGFSLTD